MLQAPVQAVDFKVGRHFGEGPFRIELSQAVGSLESRFEPVIRHTESETEWPRSEPSSHFPVVD